MTFEVQVFGEEDCVKAITREVPIKIGLPGANVQTLNKEFGIEAVSKACTPWSIIISQIIYPLILN